LAGHRVGDEQGFGHGDRCFQAPELLHQLAVDLEAARRVQDHDVAHQAPGFRDRGAGDALDLALARVERNPFATGKRLELLDSGRTPEVQGCDERLVPFATREQGELHGRGGLAGALQSDEHDHGRWRRRITQAFGIAAQQLDQLLVDRLDHLLRRGQAWRNLGTLQPDADALHELLDHLEVDIGLEQSKSHLSKACVDVLWSQDSAARDLLQGGGKPLAERLEHLVVAGSFNPSDATPQPVHVTLQRFYSSATSRSFRKESKPALVLLEGLSRAAHDVVHGSTRRALVLGDLGQRPIAAQVEVNNLALVVGQQRAVALVKGKRAAARLKGVKGHALTA
jgi:hypothetical protein